jgi:hypothetical protein
VDNPHLPAGGALPHRLGYRLERAQTAHAFPHRIGQGHGVHPVTHRGGKKVRPPSIGPPAHLAQADAPHPGHGPQGEQGVAFGDRS